MESEQIADLVRPRTFLCGACQLGDHDECWTSQEQRCICSCPHSDPAAENDHNCSQHFDYDGLVCPWHAHNDGSGGG